MTVQDLIALLEDNFMLDDEIELNWGSTGRTCGPIARIEKRDGIVWLDA